MPPLLLTLQEPFPTMVETAQPSVERLDRAKGSPMIVDIIDRAKNEGRTVLTEVESKQILEEAGIPPLAPSSPPAATRPSPPPSSWASRWC